MFTLNQDAYMVDKFVLSHVNLKLAFISRLTLQFKLDISASKLSIIIFEIIELSYTHPVFINKKNCVKVKIQVNVAPEIPSELNRQFSSNIYILLKFKDIC